MDAKSAKQARAEAIFEALSTSDVLGEADEDQDIEAFAQRFEASVSRAQRSTRLRIHN